VSAPTWIDLFNIGKAEAIDRRPDLAFDVGDISEMFVSGFAAMADHLIGFFAARFLATYLDGAQGDDLTQLADDHWNIQRNLAKQAKGQVVFSRTNGNGAPSGTYAAGSVISTQTDASGNTIQYTTDADVIWASSDTSDKSVNVTAVNAGSSSNAAINTVTKLITTPFDNTITVNNPAQKMVGGADQESDPDLRDRVRNFSTTLRRATLAALEYAAIQTKTTSVAKATAIEELDDENNPTGLVDVYIADSEGNSNQAMVDAVTTEMINWRAAGIVVNVVGGALLTQNVDLTITARAGIDTQTLVANIQAAVAQRINKLKIGESLTVDIITQAVRNVSDDILTVTVNTPSVTVVPAANQLIQCGTVAVH